MVERFNGRIADVLRTHHFQSGKELEHTIMRYVGLYDNHLPQAKEPLNRTVLIRRSRSVEILKRCRDGFCRLSLVLSYFFVALMPFLRPFLHNRRNTAY